jgi:hypothetical protein
MEMNFVEPEHAQSGAAGEKCIKIGGAVGQGQPLECWELKAGWHEADAGTKIQHDGGGAVEARQLQTEGKIHKAQGEDQDELLRVEPCGGAEQRPEAGLPVLLADAPARLGEADLEEGNRGRGRREAAERRFERVERDVAEDDPAEACPEAVPAAGEDAGARGGAGAGEAGEDEQEKIVGEGADVVWSALVAEG